MWVLCAPTASKVTSPSLRVPSIEVQAISWSGICWVMRASHSRRTPAMLATQCSRVSSSWRTSSTPSMKTGNSSNWVHWS